MTIPPAPFERKTETKAAGAAPAPLRPMLAGPWHRPLPQGTRRRRPAASQEPTILSGAAP